MPVTATSLNHYCAFLRGVNVKGTAMKMAEVCSVFTNAGMFNVSSVLASGNIIFSSDKSATELKPLLEKTLSGHFNYEAHLFIKDKKEVANICVNNPFGAGADFHVYAFAAEKNTANILMDEFEKSQKSAGEDARIIKANFYWLVAKGDTLNTEFGKILGRKNLKDAFTSRNINTWQKVLKALSALD